MDNLLIYLLKVTAGTTLLYLTYLLIFRKDTFYLRNRILLILTLLLPTIFPLLKIPVMSSDFAAAVPSASIENMFFTGSSFETTSEITSLAPALDYTKIILWIYIAITVLLLIRVAVSMLSTILIIKRGTVEKGYFPKIIISDEHLPPFSFFPYAVIPNEDYENGNYTDILDHEFAHLRQWHTFDLVLSELFIAFQWFNPFIWHIKKSIILNHEYLADQVSLSNNKNVKEYQYRLLSFQSELKHASLAHNFSSLIKNRIIMINKKPSPGFAKLKNILILPALAIVVYAFATPEYNYASPVSDPMEIYQATPIIQKEVKGLVIDENGKPLMRVNITCTGTVGNAKGTSTDSEGHFLLLNIEQDSYLTFYLRGYKNKSIKADFNAEMVIKMIKDPDYKEPDYSQITKSDDAPPMPIVVLDGIITKDPVAVVNSKLGADLGTIINLQPKEATEKYGEAGKNGAVEIYTRNKAAELGIKIPFRRVAPDDFPTFQGERIVGFNDWVVSQLEYPPDAISQMVQGRVTANYIIEPDGSIDNVKIMGSANKLLGDEVIRAIQSSPIWEPAKNPDARIPLSASASFRFILPNKISKDDTYVVVENMPHYPGGDVALLNFIKSNTIYPETAKKNLIEGRVIVRFIVNTEGDAEEPIILKGVHPLLDAEAQRVISRLKGFSPGTQGGKPVNVYYMAPVNFSLSAPEPLFSKTAESDLLKFFGMNTGYPQAAKNSSDTGTIFVQVKLVKGGVQKECNVFTEKTSINVPLLPELVIVGYKDAIAPGDLRPGETKRAGKEALKNESLRVANKLTVNEVPQWNDKDMEFAIPVKFILK